MKTIITTVGTSLFENYMREEVEKDLFAENNETYTPIKTFFNRLKKTDNANEYESAIHSEDIKKIKKIIDDFWLKDISKNNSKWVFQNGLNEYASAEIESILKIITHFSLEKEEVRIILISTDTILSRLACEILENILNLEYFIETNFNKEIDVIKKLRIDNADDFEEGLVQFAKRFYQIYSIAGEEINPYYAQDFILNITGGYKGLIPFVTIFGQVNMVKVCYKFEDTNQLMVVPQIPIKLRDKEIFSNQKYLGYFAAILKGNTHINNFDYDFYAEKAIEFVSVENQHLKFTLIGKFFWEKFNSKQFFFYCSDDVYNDILSFNKIKEILEQDFHYAEQRKSHMNPEPNEHKMTYKQARSEERIYYFEKNSNIYIYKVFVEHILHERYFKAKQFALTEERKNEIIEISSIRTITKTK